MYGHWGCKMKKHSVLSWVFISYCVKSLNLNLKLGRYYSAWLLKIQGAQVVAISYMRTETKIKLRALTCLSLTSNQVEMCIQFIVSCGSFETQSCGNWGPQWNILVSKDC